MKMNKLLILVAFAALATGCTAGGGHHKRTSGSGVPLVVPQPGITTKSTTLISKTTLVIQSPTITLDQALVIH